MRIGTQTYLMLIGFALILMQATQQAQAQLGPSFDRQVKPTTQSFQEPIIDLIETPRPVQTQVDQLPTLGELAQQTSESRPLGLPRSSSESQSIGDSEVTTPSALGKDFIQSVAALAGVLLLIFALAQLYKRIARTRGGLSGQIGAGGKAPAGLVEVLARYPISSGMTLVVLRFDRRVLLLSHAGGARRKRALGGGAMQTLCELDQAEDVASILAKVRDDSGDSIAASFERTLMEAGNATDQHISQAMYQPKLGVNVQAPRRVAPGFLSNDEGDRYELTSQNDAEAASQVLRRRLGAMRRGR